MWRNIMNEKKVVLSDDADITVIAYKMPKGSITVKGIWKSDKIKDVSFTLTAEEVEKLKVFL